MEKLRLNRNLIFVILTIFIFVCGIQIADPVSATSTAASGTKYIKSANGHYYKYTWKIYKVGKYRAIKKARLNCLNPEYGIDIPVYMTNIFDKINKKQIRVRYYLDGTEMVDHVMKSKYAAKYSAYNYAKWYNYGVIKGIKNCKYG